MGSDTAPHILFEGIVQAAAELPTSDTLVVLAPKVIADELPHPASASGASIEFFDAPEVIAMDEPPLQAVRRKRKSSLVMGIGLVRDGDLDAIVSAGNTGALIASATMMLQRLPGIHRPALLTVLPSLKGSVAVLDVGGHVSLKARHLVQFAQMGAAYQQCTSGIEAPSVGLLNIGVEDLKGTSEVREAFQALQDYCARDDAVSMAFKGNVEGREVFQGKVDVLVTDGFTGNVFLKTAEGVSAFILEQLQLQLQNTPSESAQGAVTALARHVNYDEYPGAIVCGVDGVVVKCHGYSSSLAMYNGIKGAIALVEHGLVAKIKTLLQQDEE